VEAVASGASLCRCQLYHTSLPFPSLPFPSLPFPSLSLHLPLSPSAPTEPSGLRASPTPGSTGSLPPKPYLSNPLPPANFPPKTPAPAQLCCSLPFAVLRTLMKPLVATLDGAFGRLPNNNRANGLPPCAGETQPAPSPDPIQGWVGSTFCDPSSASSRPRPMYMRMVGLAIGKVTAFLPSRPASRGARCVVHGLRKGSCAAAFLVVRPRFHATEIQTVRRSSSSLACAFAARHSPFPNLA
jgi:hypothetical protein